MKKLLFAFMAVALIASASSCKKCGYCRYSNGDPNSEAVCSSTNAFESLDGNSYKEDKAQCSADNGVWVTTK